MSTMRTLPRILWVLGGLAVAASIAQQASLAAPKRASRGTVGVGPVTTRGGIDPEIIRRIFVRRHLGELVSCYEKGLAKAPDLAGGMTIHFTVTVTGKASACKVDSSTLQSPLVEGCVVAAVRRWEFPRSFCGCETWVSVALEFAPKEQEGK
jgi:hypothetical protein